jgi:hypothetical protein
MSHGLEQLFIYLFGLCISFSVRDLSRSFAHFSLWLFFVVALGFDLRASGLLGRSSYCLSHSASPLLPTLKLDYFHIVELTIFEYLSLI